MGVGVVLPPLPEWTRAGGCARALAVGSASGPAPPDASRARHDSTLVRSPARPRLGRRRAPPRRMPRGLGMTGWWLVARRHDALFMTVLACYGRVQGRDRSRSQPLCSVMIDVLDVQSQG